MRPRPAADAADLGPQRRLPGSGRRHRDHPLRHDLRHRAPAGHAALPDRPAVDRSGRGAGPAGRRHHAGPARRYPNSAAAGAARPRAGGAPGRRDAARAERQVPHRALGAARAASPRPMAEPAELGRGASAAPGSACRGGRCNGSWATVRRARWSSSCWVGAASPCRHPGTGGLRHLVPAAGQPALSGHRRPWQPRGLEVEASAHATASTAAARRPSGFAAAGNGFLVLSYGGLSPRRRGRLLAPDPVGGRSWPALPRHRGRARVLPGCHLPSRAGGARIRGDRARPRRAAVGADRGAGPALGPVRRHRGSGPRLRRRRGDAPRPSTDADRLVVARRSAT